MSVSSVNFSQPNVLKSPSFSGNQNTSRAQAPRFGACTPCDPCGFVLWSGLGIGAVVLAVAAGVGVLAKKSFGGAINTVKNAVQQPPSTPKAPEADHVHGPDCNH
jgi:hypothetical protein